MLVAGRISKNSPTASPKDTQPKRCQDAFRTKVHGKPLPADSGNQESAADIAEKVLVYGPGVSGTPRGHFVPGANNIKPPFAADRTLKNQASLTRNAYLLFTI